MERIGFVGGGNMAEALIKGLIASGVYGGSDIVVSDVRAERLSYLKEEYGVRTTDENAVTAKARIVVLAVKPQNMGEALSSIKGALGRESLIISIAAGVKVERITEALGDAAVVRVMPNTPALVGEGASGLYANKKARGMVGEALEIFLAVGKAVMVEKEELIDAVTAVSGSGPAYYFLLMEEMIKAGVELGLSEEDAAELVLQTAKGAAALALEAGKEGEGPAELRGKVTSPGGTTEAAMEVLSKRKFGAMIAEAIKRAEERSKELSG